MLAGSKNPLSLDMGSVNDQRYACYFSFDNEETQILLEYYGMKLNANVKEMYDGYKMGDKEIYNPWSILNYTDNKKLIPYWVNTSVNTMIKEAIKDANYDFKEQYEKLIKNNYLETTVVLQTSFYEVKNTPSLWGLLVNAGYLTITKIINALGDRYRIEIPNKEVRKEFINLTEFYLGLQMGQMNNVVESLIEENKEDFLIVIKVS